MKNSIIMKIGLVCPASLPATQFGGILFLALDLARETAKLSHDVVIYTTDLDFANNATTFNKKLPREESIEDFTIKRSHTWLRYSLFFINPGIYFQLLKDSPDIIHTIGIRSFQSFIAALVSKQKKIPLVIADQGGLTTHPELKSGSLLKKFFIKLQSPFIKFIINQSTKIIAANEYEKKIFTEFTSASKIEIIKNGINLDILKNKTKNFKKKYDLNTPYILFIGRFSYIKGIDILLKAIKILKDDNKLQNIKFVIMGVDFGYQRQMYKMINKFDLENHILIIKNPSREDVLGGYAESEFLVLPSRWELSPLTPLEGFAFKKSVISTNIHGIPSTIKNDYHGILVESENSEQLAKCILELLSDKEKLTSFGLAGHKMIVDECNSVKMAGNTLKIYEKILSKH
jgi:glycosyltransferase involved in cell wall biosynthesis